MRYTIATGSGRPDAAYEGLFDPKATADYAARAAGPDTSAEQIAARLDLHHLVVLLQALARIENPGVVSSRDRTRTLLDLALRPLAAGPTAASIRILLRPPPD